MRITARWIHQHKTGRGGWTAEQLRYLGISWPPRKGWLRGLEGKEISDDAARLFEIHCSSRRQLQLDRDCNDAMERDK